MSGKATPLPPTTPTSSLASRARAAYASHLPGERLSLASSAAPSSSQSPDCSTPRSRRQVLARRRTFNNNNNSPNIAHYNEATHGGDIWGDDDDEDEGEWEEVLARINRNYTEPLHPVPTNNRTYDFEGVQVKFPYEAYQSQQQIMEKVIHGTLRGLNCLIESPTGILFMVVTG
jgi:hypothetical protein